MVSSLARQGISATPSYAHDALAGHGVGLLVDALNIPEALLLVLVVRAHDNGDNVQLKPESRAERRAHVLERGGQSSPDELGEVLVLVLLDLVDDEVGNEIMTRLQAIVQHNVPNGEVNQVDSVVNGQSDHSCMVVREDSGDTKVERLYKAFRQQVAGSRGSQAGS